LRRLQTGAQDEILPHKFWQIFHFCQIALKWKNGTQSHGAIQGQGGWNRPGADPC
jgi:hypothetical protein